MLLVLLLCSSVLADSLWPRSEQCCRSVLVSSVSLASREQPLRLGVYRHAGVMNRRRVYQHQDGRSWLYYYDWGRGHGANWMVGDSPGGQSRGLESINLQGRALAGQWCPEDIHAARVPWKVLTSGGSWREDTRLRVECFDPDIARTCCEVILVQSRGEAEDTYRQRMGVYTAHSELTGRTVFQHVDRTGYIYYYDWGPNSGANWMFGDEAGASYRDIESSNMETSNKSLSTECLITPQHRSVDSWNVLNGNDVTTDKTLNIQCV